MFAKLGFSFALINLSLYRFCSFWNRTLCHNVLEVHHFFFYSRDHSLIFSTLAVFARFSKQDWDCLNYGETKSYTEYTSQYDMIICQELNAIVYMPRTECYSFNCSDLQWLMWLNINFSVNTILWGDYEILEMLCPPGRYRILWKGHCKYSRGNFEVYEFLLSDRGRWEKGLKVDGLSCSTVL